MAFLLPVVEALVKRGNADPNAEHADNTNSNTTTRVSALVVCPVRELATQIFKEGKKLLRFHKNLVIQQFIGGVPVCSFFVF